MTWEVPAVKLWKSGRCYTIFRMRPNVLLMTGHQHGGLGCKEEEFSTNSTWVKALLLQNHFGINATHTEPYCIQKTPTHRATGFAAASAPLMKSGPINPPHILYLCARGNQVPTLYPANQCETRQAEIPISAELPDKPMKCSLFHTWRCRGWRIRFLLYSSNFAIHSAWTLHCVWVYHAVQ